MRITARILALILWPSLLWGQVATTAPTTTTTTQPPQKNVVITTSKQGGKISFLLSPENIPPLPVSLPALTVVPAASVTYDAVCTFPADSDIITNPDGSRTVSKVSCTFTPHVPVTP